ncbi:MAG: 50S ribosomal protein L29 [Acetobacteraceae bacterium]
MSKASELRTRSADELQAMLLELRKEQFNLRFQRATGQQEGVARVPVVRKEIARVKTVMVERRRSAHGATGQGG